MLKEKTSSFHCHEGELYAEQVPLTTIAQDIGTPTYIYSKKELIDNWRAFDSALKKLANQYQINYAVKANSNLAILNLFAKMNSGFDIVSLGELERVLKAGGKKEDIVFSGVGKSVLELKRAIEIGIGCFHIESQSELLRLQELLLHTGKKAAISIRVNPDVDAKSHHFISTGLKENKFGIPLEEAEKVFALAKTLSQLEIKGIAFHIGSQITSLEPFQLALEKILSFMDVLKKSYNIHLQDINVGGGLGVRYLDETPPTPEEYIHTIVEMIKDQTLKIHIEPGRALTANAGILLTRVEYIKEIYPNEARFFAIVDAAMNDLMRPVLYSAWQEILPVTPNNQGMEGLYDIVGPVCETADFLGKERVLCLKENDLLAIMSSGAYGFSMSSNYNSRPRAAEVMVDDREYFVIRPRESIEDLFQSERLLP